MNERRGFSVTLAAAVAASIFANFALARDSYSHVTAIEGSATVSSEENGSSPAALNLPIMEGDELATDAGSRAEVELADGCRIQIAGESRIRFDALPGQDGSRAAESAVTLLDGSIAAESMLVASARAPRIDTPDAAVYVSYRGQVRVDIDSSGSTSVVVRQGSAEVRLPSGTKTVEAGHYLLSGNDEPPELARGSFSRDRFDVWVSDRTGTLLHAYNSVSARYVDGSDYDQDVAVLDDYGQWDYSSTYQTEVWRPTVDAGWSPYTSGFWYYTPAGASWVCDEPWGWFPHHYGNWIFDAAFGSWCWSPAYAFSPAWVYWSFSGPLVGWCPIGSYAYYAPYRGYWGRHAWRSGVSSAVNGVFDPRRVDFGRGWNFVGVHRIGTRFNRGDIAKGSSIAGRLGNSVAITSAPLRIPSDNRNGGAARALQAYAQSAPQRIARTSRPEESAALTPFFAHRQTLPTATLQALETNRLLRGDAAPRSLHAPGIDVPPAAAESQNVSPRFLRGGRFNEGDTPRAVVAAPGGPGGAWRNRPGIVSDENARATRGEPASSSNQIWRQRRGEETRSLDRQEAFTARENVRSFAPPPPPGPAAQAWRQRAVEPPARRVIDGIDRGRASERALPPAAWQPAPVRQAPAYAPPPRPEVHAAPPPREAPRPAPPPARDAHPDKDRSR